MLDFLYSERCTREIKLIISILTCILIYYGASIEKLSTTLTLIGLGLGIGIHLVKKISLKIKQSHFYTQGFKILFFVLPLLGLVFIINTLPHAHKVFTALQAFGFMVLGLFIPLIYENRAKRFE